MSTQPFADKAWTVREVANDLGDRAIVKVRRRVIDPRGAAPIRAALERLTGLRQCARCGAHRRIREHVLPFGFQAARSSRALDQDPPWTSSGPLPSSAGAI